MTAVSSMLREFMSDLPAAAAPAEVGKRLSENFLARTLRFEKPEAGAGRYSHFHYAEALCWTGALRVARLTGDRELGQRLVARFGVYLGPAAAQIVPDGSHVDERVFGVLPLELYQLSREPPYLELGLNQADQQWASAGSDGITHEARYWIDDMYMITALQVQAYRATNNPLYLERASLCMVAYLERLQQPNGLFFHTPSSPVFWGRGNGWVAAGMTELLSEMPDAHPLRARVLRGYTLMLGTLLELQSSGGTWRQILDDESSWHESSASAMFTFAMASGVARGWLDAALFGPAVRRAWLGTLEWLDKDANLGEVCVGAGHAHHVVGDDPEAQRRYYDGLERRAGDLHGQAPLFWAVTALLSRPG